MYTYTVCPNNCGGEVAFDIETEDDGADDIYGPRSYQVAVYNESESVHDDGCTPLTQEQIEKLEEDKTKEIAEDVYSMAEEPILE